MAKYKINDLVLISKKFVVDGPLKSVRCEPFVARVKRVCIAPSMGPSYTVNDGKKDLSIQYWESDIDGFYYEAPDKIWEVWGDQ